MELRPLPHHPLPLLHRPSHLLEVLLREPAFILPLHLFPLQQSMDQVPHTVVYFLRMDRPRL